MIRAVNVHADELMRLTNYRVKKSHEFVTVEHANGSIFLGGKSLMKAYGALGYLNILMMSAEVGSDY